MSMTFQILITVLTGILSGGVGVAVVKGWFGVKLKKMDANEKDMAYLNDRFDELFKKYMIILEEHASLKGKSESQAHEIDMLKRKISELSGYKNQQLKLNRITKALNEYHKGSAMRDSDLPVKRLVKVLEKELL